MTVTTAGGWTSYEHMPTWVDLAVSGDEYGTWTVSWLQDRQPDRTWTMTATVVADPIGPHETDTPGGWVLHGEGLADELDWAARDAAARTSIEPHVKASAGRVIQ
jgi:hypothetical protein